MTGISALRQEDDFDRPIDRGSVREHLASVTPLFGDLKHHDGTVPPGVDCMDFEGDEAEEEVYGSVDEHPELVSVTQKLLSAMDDHEERHSLLDREEQRHWDTRELLHEKVCSLTGLHVKNRILSRKGIEETKKVLLDGGVELIRMGGDEFNLLWRDQETGNFCNYVIDFRNMGAVNNVGRSNAVNTFMQEFPDAVQVAFSDPKNVTREQKLKAVENVLQSLRDKHLPGDDEQVQKAGRYARTRSIVRNLRQEGQGLSSDDFNKFLSDRLEEKGWVIPKTYRGRNVDNLSSYLRGAIYQEWYADCVIKKEVAQGGTGREPVMEPAGVLMDMGDDLTSEAILLANEEADELLGRIKRGDNDVHPFDLHEIKTDHLPLVAQEELKEFRAREERHTLVFKCFLKACRALREAEQADPLNDDSIEDLQVKKSELRAEEREIRAFDAFLDGALRLNLCAHYMAGETFKLTGSKESPRPHTFMKIRLDKEGYSGYNNGVSHLFGDEVIDTVVFQLAKKHLGSRKFVRDTGGSLCCLIPERYFNSALETSLAVLHAESVFVMEELMNSLVADRGMEQEAREVTKEAAEAIILKLDTKDSMCRYSRQGRSWDEFMPHMLDVQIEPITVFAHQTLGEVFGSR